MYSEGEDQLLVLLKEQDKKAVRWAEKVEKVREGRDMRFVCWVGQDESPVSLVL